MNHWDYFLFLMRQVFVDGSCITIPLFVLFLGVVVRNYRVDKTPFRAVHLLALVPFLFPIWILIWGTLYENSTSGTNAYVNVPEWQFQVLWVIVIIQLLVNIGCWVYFEDLRLAIVILSLLQGFLTYVSLLVASMSIGGTWV